MAKKSMKRKRAQKPKPTTKNAGAADLVQLLIYVPLTAHRELKHESVERQMTMSAIVYEALQLRMWFVKRDGAGRVVEQAIARPTPITITGEAFDRVPGILGCVVNAPEEEKKL